MSIATNKLGRCAVVAVAFGVAIAGRSVAATLDIPALSAAAGQPQTMQIRALIGGEVLQPTVHAAVVRIGPADAHWVDYDSPIEDDATCLTQAVYYEARSESLAGQEAVAQVVINRTKRAGFPASVCGVVFERTGAFGTCQFSFVCDGSMDRFVESAAWERARFVAAQALHGFVFKPLKDATHYHAAWMTPYWSASLTRVRQIGGHVFYR